MSSSRVGSMKETGADALEIVEGMSEKNIGMRLQLKQPQNKYEDGWVRGRFTILAEGNGAYADQIRPLVGKTMNAEQLHEAILASIVKTRMTRLTILDRNSLKLVPKS